MGIVAELSDMRGEIVDVTTNDVTTNDDVTTNNDVMTNDVVTTNDVTTNNDDVTTNDDVMTNDLQQDYSVVKALLENYPADATSLDGLLKETLLPHAAAFGLNLSMSKKYLLETIREYYDYIIEKKNPPVTGPVLIWLKAWNISYINDPILYLDVLGRMPQSNFIRKDSGPSNKLAKIILYQGCGINLRPAVRIDATWDHIHDHYNKTHPFGTHLLESETTSNENIDTRCRNKKRRPSTYEQSEMISELLEDNIKLKEMLKQTFENTAKLVTEQARRDVEQAERDAKQAKRDAEQVERDARESNRDECNIFMTEYLVSAHTKRLQFELRSCLQSNDDKTVEVLRAEKFESIQHQLDDAACISEKRRFLYSLETGSGDLGPHKALTGNNGPLKLMNKDNKPAERSHSNICWVCNRSVYVQQSSSSSSAAEPALIPGVLSCITCPRRTHAGCGNVRSAIPNEPRTHTLFI